MVKTMRSVLVFVSAVQLFFALAFFLQWPPAVNLWPFEGTTPLTFIFIASIFAAAGASTLWTVVTRTDGATAGIALDYLGILLPVAIFTLRLGDPQKTIYGVICLVGAAFGLGLLIWGLRHPLPADPPMPLFLKGIFAFFIVALLIVGGRLVFKVPGSIPWAITPELSVLMGWMFLGAAVYFAYGLLRPSWANAGGQLAGFLAYDLVLVVPFLKRLPGVAAEDRLGLYIYTGVVVFSGLVAGYYLFIAPRTRFRVNRA